MITTKVGTFRQGVLTGSELREAVVEAWTEISDDPGALAELGIDSATAANVNFSVEEEGGFVAEGILLAIFIAWAGEAAWDGTKKAGGVIVAKVRERHGEDAIGDETDAKALDHEPDDEGEPR